MNVNFYATYRPIVGGKTITVPLSAGSTVQQLVQHLITEYPPLKAQLFDENGALFPHVHIFINGRDVPYLPDQMETVLSAADSIDIFPPVGGG